MSTLQQSMRTVAAFSLATIISACQPTNSGSVDLNDDGLSVSLPPVLMNARNVNRDALSPFVQLDDGTIIPMRQIGGSDNWTGQVQVVPDATYRITIEWRESLPQQDIVLARLNRDVFVGPDGEVVENLQPSAYSTEIDDDGDGFSNLLERENNSDPTNGGSVPGDTTSIPAPETPTAPTPPPAVEAPVEVITQDPETPTESEPEPETPTESEPEPDPETPTEPEPESEPEQEVEPVPESPAPDSEDELEEVEEETESPATVVIPRISAQDAPNIDGLGVAALAADGSLIGEWANAVQFDNSGVPLGINSLMIDNGATENNGDPYRRWAAMHDGTRIYILVLVDDIGLRFFDSAELIWEDDALELFIDGDNSKLSIWGDDDDFQFLIAMLTDGGDANISSESNARLLRAPQSSTSDIDLEFATGPGIGPDGLRVSRFEQDVYELSFDIAAAGITVGEPFGLELQVDDDDNDDGRDAKWGWFHPARTTTNIDFTFEDPSVMGTVELSE